MALEIERKFLVSNNKYLSAHTKSIEIEQGYLNTDPARTVRVRIVGDKACITVKGLTTGATRHEWEYEIPLQDAREMMALCTGVISKIRYVVPYHGLTWEVDVFQGRHKGLVLAEIELPDEDAVFDMPPFVGVEVTGDEKYYNSNLALNA